MTRGEITALILVAAIPTAFSLYEWGGLTIAPWHTVSYYALHHEWLAVGIGVAAFAAYLVFVAWWIHHMHTKILRLRRMLWKMGIVA